MVSWTWRTLYGHKILPRNQITMAVISWQNAARIQWPLEMRGRPTFGIKAGMDTTQSYVLFFFTDPFSRLWRIIEREDRSRSNSKCEIYFTIGKHCRRWETRKMRALKALVLEMDNALVMSAVERRPAMRMITYWSWRLGLNTLWEFVSI